MKLLYVCTGNSCRSPMAEALTNTLAQERGMDITAESCGLAAEYSSYASPNATQVMRERGIDITRHRTRRLTASEVDTADYIICMTDAHRDFIALNFPGAADKTYTLTEAVGESGDVSDPYGCDLDTYRGCAAELERCISALLDNLSE